MTVAASQYDSTQYDNIKLLPSFEFTYSITDDLSFNWILTNHLLILLLYSSFFQCFITSTVLMCNSEAAPCRGTVVLQVHDGGILHLFLNFLNI